MAPTSNFTFLTGQDAQLGALAERYFCDDPGTAVFKLRQFAELLSKTVAAHNALYLGDRETFEETLRRLSYERIIPKEAADVFHALRKAGNRAAHEATSSHSDVLLALKFARQLGIWFHRTYGKQPIFKPGPFCPPRSAHRRPNGASGLPTGLVYPRRGAPIGEFPAGRPASARTGLVPPKGSPRLDAAD